MPRLLPLLLLVLLQACSSLPGPDQAGQFPIARSREVPDKVDRALVLIPGAFASVDIFRPAVEWHLPRTEVVAYRFPGMDQLPLDHQVEIRGSARLIADYVNALNVQHVDIIGYSTGGPIAIETVERLNAPDIRVALVSSATSFPGPLLSTLRGTLDFWRASLRSHFAGQNATLTENYRTLLYGEDHYSDPTRAEESEALADKQRATMIRPSLKETMAQTASLLRWRLEPDPDLHGARIRLFHGSDDPVFPLPEARKFASRLHADGIRVYEGQGHLLYVTSGSLFDDIRDFFGR
ncbi:alpha/beta hydrolase [Pseudooceanicola sp. CBS1P-1]|uniref:Alpha/beta hydrolase n=1 Tax=Pseudooceanicola albus TaxID=2692189 RepID=A0A6L7G3W8_9RHOB|nr:alpha/beta hydrolase [Pseudooceanicola endophyticus]MXN18372.1 alpha/beta hydrolase [Pseudooceanicola albus]